MVYRAEIVDAAPDLLDKFETVRIGWRPGFGLSCTLVQVFEDENPRFHLECFSENNEYHFRFDVVVWHDLVALGLGHRLCLLNLNDRSTTVIDLDSYFGHLHPTDRILLVTSGCHVHAVSAEGKLVWIAKNLGIDGVVINKIEANTALGESEFDPCRHRSSLSGL